MSCQDACVVQDYDGSSSFYSGKFVKAAKPHCCVECFDVIAKGDRYHYAAGKSDGDFWDAKTCVACEEIRRAFVCGGSFVISALWEDIRDQLFPKWNFASAIDCLAKLTSDAATAKMKARYAEYVEDQS